MKILPTMIVLAAIAVWMAYGRWQSARAQRRIGEDADLMPPPSKRPGLVDAPRRVHSGSIEEARLRRLAEAERRARSADGERRGGSRDAALSYSYPDYLYSSADSSSWSSGSSSHSTSDHCHAGNSSVDVGGGDFSGGGGSSCD